MNNANPISPPTQCPRSVRRNRGMTSVLAMIYLTVVAMLAVGFYTAIDMGSNIADNEQYINRSATAAEVGMAFARYYLSPSQLTLPAGQTNLLSAVQAKLSANTLLASYPAVLSTSGTTIYLPGANGSPTWMNTDTLGGQSYIAITNPSGQNLLVESVGQNTNSRVTTIRRLNQITLQGPQSLAYGLVSYGEIVLSGNDKVTGNGGVLSVTSGATKPIISVGSGNSFANDFYWTNSAYSKSNITWGTLTVDGLLSTQGTFPNHIHLVGTPTKPTFDTSAFANYVGSANPYGGATYTTATYNSNATTLTNVYLTGPSASYTFNNLSTINGVLYLGSGVSVTFNRLAGLAITGAIVQANGATGGTLNFNGPVTQTSMSTLSGPDFPAGLVALTGSAMICPTDAVSFAKTVSTADSIVGGSLAFSGNVTVASGSVLSLLPASNLAFNGSATLNITTSSNVPAGENFQFTPAPGTYSEPQYTGTLP